MKTFKNSNGFHLNPIAHAVNSQMKYAKVIGLLPLCMATSAIAVENEEIQIGDDSVVLEKIIVTDKFSRKDLTTSEMEADILKSKRAAISDTAKLLEETPGVSLYQGGGVSSLPVIHGLNDDRVNITVNGMTISSACANHMNPPLSYIDRSNIGKITILTGISPVSLGGDSLGGTVKVETPAPVFAEPGKDILLDGSISAFYRNNGDAYGGSIAAGIANQNVRLEYTGSSTKSMNYNDGNGDVIGSTQYENQNQSAALSFKFDNHLLTFRGGMQHIPYQGFVNQRMDMTNNDSLFGNIDYKGLFDWGTLESRFYYEHTIHNMDIAGDKQNRFANKNAAGQYLGVFAPPNNVMPMDTNGINLGYKIQGEIPYSERDTFRVGTDFHAQMLNDYWPPVHTDTSMASQMQAMQNGRTGPQPNMAYWMMAPDTYYNINDGQRNRVGFFGEWEANWDENWRSMLGFRYDRVMMDTGDVQPYNPDLIMSPMAGALVDYTAANAFNAQDHERNFNLFDFTALVQYAPNDMSQYELGFARKNRAPNLYELYTWGQRAMDMGMIGWFGDGNGYVGNLNLKEETANTVSFTAAFNEPSDNLWQVSATPYFTYVEDYVDVDRCQSEIQGSACNAPTQSGSNDFVYLQFANHDAWLTGVDVSGRAQLYKHKTFGVFGTHAIMSYVRGQRTDGVDLYHMMPFNLKWSLDHRLESWQTSLEMQFVDGKTDVSSVRNETTTPSYILLNARTGYEWGHVRFDLGLENMLDKQYYSPMGGAYLGDRYGMNPTGPAAFRPPWGRNVPGMGRSMYVGVTIKY